MECRGHGNIVALSDIGLKVTSVLMNYTKFTTISILYLIKFHGCGERIDFKVH